MRLQAPVKALLEALSYFLYPPRCLHCKTADLSVGKALCEPCAQLILLLEPEGRCLHCFIECDGTPSLCLRCRKEASFATALGSACEYNGPIVSLICALKYGNQPHLAKTLAALMTAQLIQLNWPLPDLIVPVPISRLKRLDRGYNQCALLAIEMGKMIKRPVKEVLKRHSGDWSQAGLSLEQRKQQTCQTYYLAKDAVLYDQTILLIDDVLTTGTTIANCAKVLASGCPEHIYVLTTARAS